MKNIECYETKAEGAILLNANESSENLEKQVMMELQQAVVEIAFNRYPDADNRELINTYATVAALQADQILAGNGSDEMLGLMIGYFLGKGKKLYTLLPDFSMYDYYASMHEAEVIKHACAADGSFQVKAFIEQGKQQHVDMIVFSNPNNPSGHLVSKSELEQIITAFPDIPVIIDEAYGEFAKETMLYDVNRYANLYVTRTLSKAYGLAGARLGFLIANAQAIAQLKPFVVPYNISSIAQKVGVVVLSHAMDFQPKIQAIKVRRERFYEAVKEFTSVHFYPSHANYLFGRCAQKAALLEAFQAQGIVIRDYAKQDSFRITIGNEAEMALVLQVLQAFEKEASPCVG